MHTRVFLWVAIVRYAIYLPCRILLTTRSCRCGELWVCMQLMQWEMTLRSTRTTPEQRSCAGMYFSHLALSMCCIVHVCFSGGPICLVKFAAAKQRSQLWSALQRIVHGLSFLTTLCGTNLKGSCARCEHVTEPSHFTVHQGLCSCHLTHVLRHAYRHWCCCTGSMA